MSTSLTAEQQKRIEESRQRALAIRAEKQNATLNQTMQQGNSNNKSAKSFYSVDSNKSVPESRVSHCQKTSDQSISKYKQSGVGRGNNHNSSSPVKSVVTQKKASCVLINRQRFQVNVDYCAPAIEIFKTVSSKLYGLLHNFYKG